jgi:hypothetical protein
LLLLDDEVEGSLGSHIWISGISQPEYWSDEIEVKVPMVFAENYLIWQVKIQLNF